MCSRNYSRWANDEDEHAWHDMVQFVPKILNRRLCSLMTSILLDTSIESASKYRVVSLMYYIIFELSFEKKFRV